MAKRPSKKSKKPTPVPLDPFPADWLPVHEAVNQVQERLRKARPPRRAGGLDGWDRMVKHIAKRNSLDAVRFGEVEDAIAWVQRGWSDDQKRHLYRDLKTYVPEEHRRGRSLESELPADEAIPEDDEWEDEEWSDAPIDEEDDGYDIPGDHVDFVTKDGLLDAVLSRAWGDAFLLEEREKKAAKARQRGRSTKRGR